MRKLKNKKLKNKTGNNLGDNKISTKLSNKSGKWAWLYYFVFIVIILVILGIAANLNFSSEKSIGNINVVSKPFISFDNSTLVAMKLPAVDADGNGVTTELLVEATSGSGRTLVDIESLLFWADTQHSIRVARNVAGKVTGKNLNDFDLVYSVSANASIIGGPSAGSALVIATVAALENKPLREDVMITGTINHDGSIGPVSAILEKAKASKQAGATLFLVPLLQSGDVVYETSEHCETFGYTEICTEETRPIKVNVTEEAGINVVEVSSVQEAMKYFF